MSQSIITTHNVDAVAEFLHKSVHSVYADSIRNPSSLPPVLRVPGSSKLLFCNMYEWAASLLAQNQSANAPITPSLDAPKKKRGRPSHASRAAIATQGV